jgi:hypothetical protein
VGSELRSSPCLALVATSPYEIGTWPALRKSERRGDSPERDETFFEGQLGQDAAFECPVA